MESFSGGAVTHYPSLLTITDHYWPGKPNISLLPLSLKYSLVGVVLPNTEELISRPLLGL